MATLQKIRSQGPLLVIVVGLALFAFIAGDAWKILRPNQVREVGKVNGESLSMQEYQTRVEEYTEIIKSSYGINALNDDQLNQARDEVWTTYVNNKLVEKEAKKLGLTVSKAEVQAIIDEGTDPMLQRTPFSNPQTGLFDKDMLKMFLVSYARMNTSTMSAQNMEYYESMNRFWLFIERNLIQNRLVSKYMSLITQSVSSNPVEAQIAFDNRVNQAEMTIVAIPYTSIPDSAVNVKESELKNLYSKKKTQFIHPAETRNIRYINVQVTASTEDRALIEKDVFDYSEQLANVTSDYTAFIRSTASDYPYVDLYYRKEAYPADVASRLEEASEGKVFDPYYNVSDNTYNTFKYLSKTKKADSIQYRQIQVFNEDLTKTRTLADSIFNALKKGADFTELAQKYGQEGASNWLTSVQYENAPLEGDNLKYLTALTTLGVNEYENVSLGQGNIIFQVTNQKAIKEKFKVAVIKRKVEFSKETYNKAYNDFSRFIAANPTLEQVKANAEEAGYTLLENTVSTSGHGIANVRATKDALRWAFSAKPGEVSNLYECGNSDQLLLVGLEKVNKKGYIPLKEVKTQLLSEIIKDKKAEMILKNIEGATTFDQYKAVANAVSDTVKFVTFSASAYISVLRNSEPLVSVYASVGEPNQLSAPIKGDAGVYVLQIYNQEKQDTSFDVKEEKANRQNENMRVLGYAFLLNELQQKANVQDNRYLFF
ncbi:hypothetical protein EZS27_009695 [termite gut metagenome]|uniref:Peptidylprolyl isomerase n=1 Tax=termite gut metagenome TaxID=433724 RepID=A0A5J4SA08_9ZZZZ